MKKLISIFTLVALVFSITLSAQEEPKKAKTEKSCSKEMKKSCGTEKKAGCCAAKKAAEKKA
jgi:hypothetical protein